jgi:hypothetical protein
MKNFVFVFILLILSAGCSNRTLSTKNPGLQVGECFKLLAKPTKTYTVTIRVGDYVEYALHQPEGSYYDVGSAYMQYAYAVECPILKSEEQIK